MTEQHLITGAWIATMALIAVVVYPALRLARIAVWCVLQLVVESCVKIIYRPAKLILSFYRTGDYA